MVARLLLMASITLFVIAVTEGRGKQQDGCSTATDGINHIVCKAVTEGRGKQQDGCTTATDGINHIVCNSCNRRQGKATGWLHDCY